LTAEKNAYDRFTRRLFLQNQFAIKYDLAAMRDAVEILELPPPARHVVLIGGTNGKGTTASLLASMCIAAGLKTGLYTSPHLVDFRERIRVDGAPIRTDACLAAGEEIYRLFAGRDATPQTSRPLSYFEMVTLMAWRHFVSVDVDVAILEVGLGGRLDATNVTEPDVSIITSVSIDHTSYLGETVAAIAREKVEIARAGRPLLVHRSADGVDEMIRACQELGFSPEIIEASEHIADDPTHVRAQSVSLARRAFHYVSERSGLPSEVRDFASYHGPTYARWPGRQQEIRWEGREILLDGAHNPSATRQSAKWLAAKWAHPSPTTHTLIVGLTPGRDVHETLSPLAPIHARFVVVPASSYRSVPPSALVAALHALGATHVEVAPSVTQAIDAYVKNTEIAIVGSLYLVGDALNHLGFAPEHLVVYAPPD